MFFNCSTCFGRHITHPIRSSKTVIAVSGFTYVFGCRLPLRWLSHRSGRQPKTYVKPEAAITVFELLMRWAMCRPKHVEQLKNFEIINSATRLHLVGSFYEIYITMHGSMNINVYQLLVSHKRKFEYFYLHKWLWLKFTFGSTRKILFEFIFFIYMGSGNHKFYAAQFVHNFWKNFLFYT